MASVYSATGRKQGPSRIRQEAWPAPAAGPAFWASIGLGSEARQARAGAQALGPTRWATAAVFFARVDAGRRLAQWPPTATSAGWTLRGCRYVSRRLSVEGSHHVVWLTLMELSCSPCAIWHLYNQLWIRQRKELATVEMLVLGMK